jgi:hypothetical protein
MPFSDKYVNEARVILEDLARKVANPICYLDLTKRIGIAARSAGAVLVPISEKSYKANGILLSALAVNKKTGIPSEGFFEQAKKLGAMRDDDLPQLFFRAELERIYDAYKA